MGPLSFTQALAITLGGALAVGTMGIGWRARLWRRAKPAPVDVLAGLIDLPRRYLVHVHGAVIRTPRAARMHVPVASGFVLLIAGFTIAWISGDLAAVVVLTGAILLAAGSALDLLRRAQEAAHLTRNWYAAFPWSLLSLSLAAALGAMADLWGWTYSILEVFLAILLLLPVVHLSWGLAAGPLRHAFVGTLHLIFHPRPERFTHPARGAALHSIDIANPKLGAAAAPDLAWNAVLGVDACVQCGKCEAACPALAAGQPLNPKALIADLAAQASLDWQPYAGRRHTEDDHPVGVIRDETLWSCTTCRACVEACPMLIEHVDAVIDLRRFRVLEQGTLPSRTDSALTALRETGNADNSDPKDRAIWTAGLSIKRLTPGEQVDILLWQGEGAFQPRGRRALRALAEVLSVARVSFAILGEEEIDCGDLARRAGDEALFIEMASRVIALLAGYRFCRIVTADPHAMHALRNEYPALGGHWRVQHHSEVLAELVECGLPLQQRPRVVTYHDPCYLARYNRQATAPRAVLTALGFHLEEMMQHGTSARCCGGGGAAPLADIPGRTRIPDLRMADAAQTRAESVAVACPGCAAMLSGVTGIPLDVKDIAEFVAEALFAGKETAA
ncbi:DUF3483 domain-containing protein [Bradyrhizobium prioriisuperbiae]|uniref:DUF3483 domain-containing protein n=1 Tax=Bradyrhizobium prioriisuperbiae TaxID=2854389 RepID=UPI0028E33F74|nr:DUF3483 domain-containing protein [Bradyrhizobium prioritasuperba]